MLNLKVYNNVMYMMYHRGMEVSEYYIDKIIKNYNKPLISDIKLHNIGLDFKSDIKSDLKDVEERIMMSFCITDENRKIRQCVFFGVNSKTFLEYMTTVIIKNDNLKYETFYTLVLPKNFTSKINSKISIISSKISINIFLDEEFMKPPFHAYEARYELMTDEELNKVLSDIHITFKEAKIISSNHPIIKYYGYPVGKCVRMYQTPMIEGSFLKETIDYRIIVKAN